MQTGSHMMEFPRRIVVGEGVLRQLGDFIDFPAGRRSAVISSGSSVQGKIGDAVTEALDADVHWVEVGASDIQNVDKVIKATRGAFCIIGIGGGKSVDVGKLAAFRMKMPFFSVPTSASHDGIASPFASISGMGTHYSEKAKPPVGILADIDVISAAPKRLEAAGCGDLISKLTAVKDWELANKKTGEYYGGYAASLAMMSARVCLDGSKKLGAYDKGSARVLVEGLISAGVAAGIAGSSRPCSGSEHLFSHALDSICPGKGLHGEQCGIGTIMMASLHGLDWRKVRRALKDVKAPTSTSELGISDDETKRALVEAPSIRPDRYTILSKVKLTKKTAGELARATGVI
ncbi:MAG TPA: NAD(P)-dependent glycerol-1-phosphate dehydrogenase [Nitrososphaerales archaeon]|nr:NAD(P)-dependent glycerol-1-phosphate dehydrogenase [Nitrososphaerales archaeon]